MFTLIRTSKLGTKNLITGTLNECQSYLNYIIKFFGYTYKPVKIDGSSTAIKTTNENALEQMFILRPYSREE